MKNFKTNRDIKKSIYKNFAASFLIIGASFALFVFFTPVLGSILGRISKLGKSNEEQNIKAPPPPYFYSPPTITNQKQILLKGAAEPGNKILLYVNGPLVDSTIADSGGNFTFNVKNLIEGKNTIYARTEDSKKNLSEKSQIIELVYDNQKPEIKIFEPKDKSVVKNLNQRVLVTGWVSEKAEVRINEKLAILKSDNTFELLLGVKEGEVEINVEAIDEAGNKSEEKIKITYVNSGI